MKEDSSLPLSAPCLVPNPVSDKTVLRSWEIQVQADRWMVPREELVLGVELGHGYFGSVHKGVWRQNMEVAIKTLRHKEGKTEAEYLKEKTTFLSETEIMKDLNHPNLVKMLGICVEKSPFYLVQELCQNGDLKHYLKTFEFVKVYQHINYLQSKSKKSEKLKSVPSFNSLVNWCSDILKGTFNFLLLLTVEKHFCIKVCAILRATIWFTETWQQGMSSSTIISRRRWLTLG